MRRPSFVLTALAACAKNGSGSSGSTAGVPTAAPDELQDGGTLRFGIGSAPANWNAVTVDGNRDILGLWAGDGGEGAKYWLQVLTEIKNRGVEDVLMVVCDGLKDLPDAVIEQVLLSMDRENRERLEQALSRTYSKPVQLNVVIDPDVVGGLRVQVGDEVIDGTVARRLDDARRALAG